MKSHKNITDRQESLAEAALAEALLTMRTASECRAFLRDLWARRPSCRAMGRSLGSRARPGRRPALPGDPWPDRRQRHDDRRGSRAIPRARQWRLCTGSEAPRSERTWMSRRA